MSTAQLAYNIAPPSWYEEYVKKKLVSSLILLILASQSLAEGSKRLRILYTAERHGRLTARPSPPPIVPNLPRAKRGGLARLVSFLNEERKSSKDPLLVISGGGEVAGGPYDLEEGAPSIGGLRTDLILRGLKMSHYDALCLGDEEFGLGLITLRRWQERLDFPFLSANVEISQEELPFKSYHIIERGGHKVALIGLTTPDLMKNEFGMALPERLVVHSPVATGVALARKLRYLASLVILVSHIGEMENRKILAQLDFPVLILSAHRRRGPDIFYKLRHGWLLDFDYGVSELREVDVDFSNGPELSLKRHLLYQSLPEAKSLKEQVKVAQQLAGKTRTLDVYALADCPHCGPVEELVASLAEQKPNQLKVRKFILTPTNEKPAHRLAESHLWRANRLSISKSPQLFIGNVPYDGPLERLKQTIELSLTEKEIECKPLPRLDVEIILAKEELRKSYGRLTTALDALFPNCHMKWRLVDSEEEYDELPQLFLHGPVEQWPRFQETLSEFLVPTGKGYRITKDFVPPTYFPRRKKKRGLITLLARRDHIHWLHSLFPLLEKLENVQVEIALLGIEATDEPAVGRLLAPSEIKTLLSSLPAPLPLPAILLNNREILLPRDEEDVLFLLERAELISHRGTLKE